MAIFFRNKTTLKTGIEITPENFTCVVLKQNKDNIALEDIHIHPIKENIIKNGQISNSILFKEELENFIQKYDIQAENVSVSIPANMAFLKNINLPNLPPEELKIIVPQEALKQIPFMANEATIDYDVLQLPSFQALKNKAPVIIAAVSKEIIKNNVEIFADCGLTIESVDITSFSAIRALAHADMIDEAEELNILALIDYENTEIAIIYKGMPIFNHSIPIGKRNLITSLVTEMSLKPDEAIKFLPTIDLVDFDEEEENSGLVSIQGIYNTICGEIKRSINNYFSQFEGNIPINKIILCGSGVCIKGIDEFFKEKLNINTVTINPLQNIQIENMFQDIELEKLNLAALTNCVGLALKGL